MPRAYVFIVTPDTGSFRLELWRSGEGEPTRTRLIGETPSPAIQADTEWNRLVVRAVEADILLLVNGQLVGQVHDETLQTGGPGTGRGQGGGGAGFLQRRCPFRQPRGIRGEVASRGRHRPRTRRATTGIRLRRRRRAAVVAAPRRPSDGWEDNGESGTTRAGVAGSDARGRGGRRPARAGSERPAPRAHPICHRWWASCAR